MKDYHNKKIIFVRDYLSPMLVATNVGIISAEFVVSNEMQREYVVITFVSGEVKKVNVTADSLIAMLYDVTRSIL